MKGHYPKVRIPTFICSLGHNTAEVEVSFPVYLDEGWILYAQLLRSRKLYQLVDQVMPVLKGMALIDPDFDVTELEKLIQDIPIRARDYRENFFRQQRAIDETRPTHDPRQGVRANPKQSLFKL